MILTEHNQHSLEKLAGMIASPSAPIRRSTHVGNQPAHEIVLMTQMPKGIEIMMVDTIMGNDTYSMPKLVRLNGEPIPLCTRREAIGRVAGSITVNPDCLPTNPALANKPIPGEPITDFHTRSISMLRPNNLPVSMTEFFATHREIFEALMNSSVALGEVTRHVAEDGTIGKVAPIDVREELFGIFGVDDVTPNNQGLLVPLNGMMAMDMAISVVACNSDKTTHLAGPHMVEYTLDRSRMRRVGNILAKTAAELGEIVTDHFYEVVDITGYADLVPSVTHISQHELLRSGVV